MILRVLLFALLASAATAERLPAPPPRPAQAGAVIQKVPAQSGEGASKRLGPGFSHATPDGAPALMSRITGKTGGPLPAPPRRPAAPARAAGQPGPAAGGGLCNDARVSGARLAEIAGKGRCGIPNPIRLTGVAGVALRPPVTVACETARGLADWVQSSVRPALAARGEAPATLTTMAGYACRTRNHRPGARLSEHSFGRAIDIGGVITTGGREITVLRDWNGPNGALMRRLWRDACGPFKTVLGPESDPYHRNHFHLDVARRRSTYCR